ncbi:MAG: polysaccharide pyruvyl transferase family protein [Bacteroidales bacterium]|nr:polysaccharide pyruvyl transferase family protein [Bacteroidales bacterium]
MNISLLTGAYKNAGDFLIVDRCKKLLRYVYPDCNIVEYERRKPLNDYLETINRSDCLILAGGPAYQRNIYPQSIPLVDDLSLIKVPIFGIGLGWKGETNSNTVLYNYHFSEKTLSLLQRMQKDGVALPCRDWYSVRALRNNGFKNVVMTGCPAWYNIDFLNSVSADNIFQKNPIENKGVIAISDPAYACNFDLVSVVIDELNKRYPQSKKVLLFHRGVGVDKDTPESLGIMQQKLYEKIETDYPNVEIVDASRGIEKLSIYEKCDLHIGFRVHAHIYNLSMGNHSLLIEEDARGAGVNEIFGLPSVKTYNDYRIAPSIVDIIKRRRVDNPRNLFFSKNIADMLDRYEAIKTFQYNHIMNFIKSYFEVCVNYIRLMKEHI